MNNQKLNIAILFGGKSVEHEISIITAIQAINQIDRNIYNIYPIYLTKENNLYYNSHLHTIESVRKVIKRNKITNVRLYAKGSLCILELNPFTKIKIDIAMPIVHGEGAEDGTIIGLLRTCNCTIVAPSLISSAIIQDKCFTKDILRQNHIPTLSSLTFSEADPLHIIIEKVKAKFEFPVIVKPATLGSSIGISVTKTEEELYRQILSTFKYTNKILIEPYLENYTEYNQAIYMKSGKPVLSLIENVNKKGEILTFENKYEQGGLKNTFKESRVIPALLEEDLENKINNITTKIAAIFQINSVIRIDYIYDLMNKKIYVNEINAIPGSLSFYLFDKKNISYKELLKDILNETLIKKNNKKIQVVKDKIITNQNITIEK